jgi:hypothetical protein
MQARIVGVVGLGMMGGPMADPVCGGDFYRKW